MNTTLLLLMLAGLTFGAEEPSDPDSIVFDAERHSMEVAARVEAAEAALRRASGTGSVALLAMLEDPEACIRLVALQWLARRSETAQQALSAALADESNMVREAAVAILLDRGMNSRDLEELQDAVARRDDGKVRLVLLRAPAAE